MRRRLRLSRFAVLLLALAACAIAGELTLHMFPQLMSVRWQIRHPGAQSGEPFVVRPDDELGYLYPVTPESDRYGFQNAEPWPQPTSIVLLGDSLLNGAGVKMDESFPQVIARSLPQERVVNLGIAAAGPERQYRIYRQFGSDLRPRLVVAGLYLAADFENDAAFRGWLREPNRMPFLEFRGVFSVEQRGEHEPYIDWRTALKTFQVRRLLEKVRLYARASDSIREMLSPYPDRYRAADGTDMFFDEFAVQFAARPAEKHEAEIDELVVSLARLRDLVAMQGGELLVMLIPSKEELFAVSAAVRDRNVVTRTRERLREEGFAVLDLYPAIGKGADVAAPFFANDIHLTTYGNRLVADEFVSWFKRHALVEKPPLAAR
jgi:hypothetical protein